MKVSQMIKKLQAMPQDADVFVDTLAIDAEGDLLHATVDKVVYGNAQIEKDGDTTTYIRAVILK